MIGRPALTASLADARDRSLVYADLGGRLVNPEIESRIGYGWFEARMGLLSRGLLPALPESEADEIFRAWRCLVLRLYLDAELVWVGRIARIERGPRTSNLRGGEPTRTVRLVSRGLWLEYTHAPASASGSFTDEQTTVTASDFVSKMTDEASTGARRLVQQQRDLVAPTSVNIGPIQVGYGDYPHDLINQVLKAGSALGEEYMFLFYEGPGPILARRGGEPRWRHDLVDSGLGDAWDLNEYVSHARAIYTDEQGGAQATELAINTDALAMHHDIDRHRTITLSHAQLAGAEAGRDAFLNEHGDPIGFTGSLAVKPERGYPYARMPNAYGGLEPGWRVRAGDVVELAGELPRDPYYAHRGRLRSYVIERTVYRTATQTLEITPEAKALRSRLNESPQRIMATLRAIEPLSSRQPLVQANQDGTQTVSSASATLLTGFGESGAITFHWPRMSTARIVLGILGDSAAGGEWVVGYELDGEGYSGEDGRSLRIHEDNSGQSTPERTFDKVLRAGEHTIKVYGIRESGTGGVTLKEGRLKVYG